jgi:uncharacterized membrane protein YjjB (DUF3815 family)
MLVWGVLQFGNLFGFWQGTFLGAAVLVIYSDWVARRFSLSHAVITLPCVMILVPGLAALNALQIGNTKGALAGLSAFNGVLVLVIAIIGGTLVGDALTLRKLVKTGKAVTSFIEKPPLPSILKRRKKDGAKNG